MHRVRALSSAQSLLLTSAARCTQRSRLAAPRSPTHHRRSLHLTPVAMSDEPAATAAAGASPLKRKALLSSDCVDGPCFLFVRVCPLRRRGRRV